MFEHILDVQYEICIKKWVSSGAGARYIADLILSVMLLKSNNFSTAHDWIMYLDKLLLLVCSKGAHEPDRFCLANEGWTMFLGSSIVYWKQ